MAQAVDESGLTGSIMRAIKKAHPTAWVFKVVGHPYQTSGIPDLLVGVDGLLVGIEVKFIAPGESRDHAVSRTTPQQRFQISGINASGAVAGVATSVEEALAIVAKAIEKREKGKR